MVYCLFQHTLNRTAAGLEHRLPARFPETLPAPKAALLDLLAVAARCFWFPQRSTGTREGQPIESNREHVVDRKPLLRRVASALLSALSQIEPSTFMIYAGYGWSHWTLAMPADESCEHSVPAA
jgi:hypothetical protein